MPKVTREWLVEEAERYGIANAKDISDEQLKDMLKNLKAEEQSEMDAEAEVDDQAGDGGQPTEEELDATARVLDQRPAEVEVYKGKDGKHYWRKVAANGETIADGSQGYSSKWAANRAAKREQAKL